MDTWNTFVDRIGQRFGEAGPEDLESSVAVALTGVGQYLPEIDRKHINLPAKAARYLQRGDSREGEIDIDEIAEQLGMPAGQSREFVQSVLAAIDEEQTGEARKHWQRNLPGEIAQALTQKSATPPANVGSRKGHTLAEGMAGSSTPLATADHGHRDSPVTGGEPRGDSKMSTSTGTTQERIGRTLAEGSPGSSRPLNEGD